MSDELPANVIDSWERTFGKKPNLQTKFILLMIWNEAYEKGYKDAINKMIGDPND